MILFVSIYKVYSDEYEATKYFVLDAMRDIADIEICSQCYLNSSNKKSIQNWFILPCKPLHELVFAKWKQFPYWPAKVILINCVNLCTIVLEF